MILRLIRGVLDEDAAPGVVASVREQLPPNMAPEGMSSLLFGFRRLDGTVEVLALSVWTDLDAIAKAVGRVDRPHRSWSALVPGGLSATHYEVVDGAAEQPLELEAPVIGVVTGRIRANEESVVHDLIRGVEAQVKRAGVMRLHVGRRVLGPRTDLVVLAVWRDRLALQAFARQRGGPVIDPRFRERVEDFDFRTYDCITAERFVLPAVGPAVLLANNEHTIVDAAPGVEAVLGIPAELVLRRRLDDLVPASGQERLAAIWRQLDADGTATGELQLERPDRSSTQVAARASANVPRDGISAWVLSASGQGQPAESVASIAARTFPEYQTVG